MERTSVNSSDIASIWYDEENEILEIEFHSWWVYQYSWVPVDEYSNLMNASSHGSYFAQNIKNAYLVTRIK